MWLITPLGFFSIVEKSSDRVAGTLTVRARVRDDLEALRDSWLPGLGEIRESANTDYRFRAVAARDAVSQAMARLVASIDYSHFKDEVAKRQGSDRESIYLDVWFVLLQLQRRRTRP